MSTGIDLVKAQRLGRSFAADPEISVPTLPRFIPELLVLPLGDDGVMVVGAEEPQVFRGASARTALMRLLPLLDGKHTLPEIAAQLPTLRTAVGDMVSLLFSRGLLEDGTDGEPEPFDESADTTSFIGRFIDASRCHPSRLAVTRRLAAATVSVVGPPDLAEYLAGELSGSGIGRVTTEPVDEAALTVVVSTQSTASVTADHAPAPGARTLLVRLGADEAHIGPLLLDQVTECPTCVTRIHPHPAGEPDILRSALWTGLAAHYAFLAVTQLAPGSSLRGLRILRLDGGELSQRTALAVRLPGCPRCGIEKEAWPPHDPRLLAWIFHNSTSLQSRAMLSPKEHQGHYLVENERLATAEHRLVWSATPAPLPPVMGELAASPPATGQARGATPAQAGPPPATSRTNNEGTALDASYLAALLARTAGRVGVGDGRRRLVPTGGNLGSVTLWVVVRDVAGLRPGVYAYDAPGHTLDHVRDVDDEDLRTALRTRAPLPDCVILGAGLVATCARKYGPFAYRLAHLDAGVALAYLHLAAATTGVRLREYPDLRMDALSLAGMTAKWEFPLPTFAVGVSDGFAPPQAPPEGAPLPVLTAPARLLTSDDYTLEVLPLLLDRLGDECPDAGTRLLAADPGTPSWAPTLKALDEVLLRRRAVRAYASEQVSSVQTRAILESALIACDRRTAAGAPTGHVRPVLGVVSPIDGVDAGVYDVDPTTADLHRRGPFDQALSRECSNQLALAAAPVTLFLVADLRAALTARGLAGYAEAALDAGSMAGEAWLRATAIGLVGCAAGGVIAGGLRRAAGMDGFNECPLLALHLGRPLGRSGS